LIENGKNPGSTQKIVAFPGSGSTSLSLGDLEKKSSDETEAQS
jgi:hypothetical protein